MTLSKHVDFEVPQTAQQLLGSFKQVLLYVDRAVYL